MPEKYNEKKRAYNMEYAKKTYKRVPLDLQQPDYDELKAAADAAGVGVNTYIKAAIKEKISRQQGA